MSASVRGDELFFSGCRPSLEIARDFVYLDTTTNKESISQADIYAVIANMFACVRSDNQGFAAKAGGKTSAVMAWSSGVYGHVLACPSNFEFYNDAILRAAFLRAASPSELLYAVDEESSARVRDIISAEASAWNNGGGAALPEFLLALATKRMRLADAHLHDVRVHLGKLKLPPYMMDLINEIGPSSDGE
ncbi:hypothetical protein PCA31118_05386 [Pandoraea captiosa]|uniref:Uncharacterized protein n=1 Tax=Pandoraea captiosa TaxID=2508302 RepID=A0A5E5AVF3_9BURK|nr:hypothetical protein PCA31118_05386 [Pandoraea captiosa]